MSSRFILASLLATVASASPLHGKAVSANAVSHPDEGELRLATLVDSARIGWRLYGGRAQQALTEELSLRAVRAAFGVAGTVAVLLSHDADQRMGLMVPLLTERPALGDLSSPFGVRRDPIRKRRRKFHRGLDYRGGYGDPVLAAGPGVVTHAKRKGGYGRVIYIDHGLGLQTRYAHLRRIHVKEGEFVPAGAQIGKIGSSGRSTGPHLHFEVRLHGKAIDPADALFRPGPTLVDKIRELFQAEAKVAESVKPDQRFIPRSQRIKSLL